MAWIRMDATGMGEIPGVVTGLFGLFLLALLWKNQYMKAS
jgi:ABC-type phosphate transport system permease subunit